MAPPLPAASASGAGRRGRAQLRCPLLLPAPVSGPQAAPPALRNLPGPTDKGRRSYTFAQFRRGRVFAAARSSERQLLGWLRPWGFSTGIPLPRPKGT